MLGEKPRGGRPNKWTERDDLELTAIACTEPPDGEARWTVRMLRDRFVELSEQHDSMSHERVRQTRISWIFTVDKARDKMTRLYKP